jgi:16S rRNA (uracil1498-N3)-methyltransferase
MRLTRVYCDLPLAAGIEVALPETAAYHAVRVLRLRPGDALVVFDGRGADFRAEIASVAGGELRVKLLERLAALSESPLRITLVQAISRGERMDWTLQKATELGVHTIVPVLSARSVVRLDERQAESKLRHWRGIVIASCEQCGRSIVPELHPPQELRARIAGDARVGQRLVLSPNGPTALAGLTSVSSRVELLIGPEGGFDDAELDAAERVGYTPVRLGPRVLRTETAGIVALTVLQTLWGDLQ